MENLNPRGACRRHLFAKSRFLRGDLSPAVGARVPPRSSPTNDLRSAVTARMAGSVTSCGAHVHGHLPHLPWRLVGRMVLEENASALESRRARVRNPDLHGAWRASPSRPCDD